MQQKSMIHSYLVGTKKVLANWDWLQLHHTQNCAKPKYAKQKLQMETLKILKNLLNKAKRFWGSHVWFFKSINLEVYQITGFFFFKEKNTKTSLQKTNIDKEKQVGFLRDEI